MLLTRRGIQYLVDVECDDRCAQTSEAASRKRFPYKPPALPPRKSFLLRFTRCYQSVLAAETVGRCKEQGSARGDCLVG